VYLSTEHLVPQEIIFTVKAIDKDSIFCSPNKSCACADIVYELARPSELFSVNRNSGHVIVNDPFALKNNSEHALIVRAFPKLSFENDSLVDKSLADEFQLIVVVQEVLGRVKRQASRKKSKTPDSASKSIESFSASFSLRTVAGEVNSLQVGGSIHYRLEIALPRASVDLLLEIHSRDSHTGNKSSPALSLYNVRMLTSTRKFVSLQFRSSQSLIVSRESPSQLQSHSLPSRISHAMW